MVLVFCIRDGSKRLFLCEKPLSNAQGRGLCEANAGYAPRGWSADDVALRLIEIGVILEALLRRHSWKKMPQINFIIWFPTDLMLGGGTGLPIELLSRVLQHPAVPWDQRIWFPSYILKKISPRPLDRLKRRVSRFFTICAKNVSLETLHSALKIRC